MPVTPTTPIRTPAARAAAVERMPTNREWFAQAERLHDADKLRRALAASHVPYRLASLELAIRAREQNARIARVCEWAVERMRRADERFAARHETPLEQAERYGREGFPTDSYGDRDLRADRVWFPVGDAA